MDIEKNNNNESTEKPIQSTELPKTETTGNKVEELNKKKPTKRIRKQATEKQLSNPLHGVKLVEILERLVERYGWEHLAERVKIRCFQYNPTMKSSLGFLRKTRWAREHVEDLFLDMLDEK